MISLIAVVMAEDRSRDLAARARKVEAEGDATRAADLRFHARMWQKYAEVQRTQPVTR